MAAATGASLESFQCPQCQATYKVVRVEAAAAPDRHAVNCVVCGQELASGDGSSFLKYFLVGRPPAGKSASSKTSK